MKAKNYGWDQSGNGTIGKNTLCWVNFQNHLRRYQAIPFVRERFQRNAKHKTRQLNEWRAYSGLGFTDDEVKLIDSGWAKGGNASCSNLHCSYNNRTTLGLQLYAGRVIQKGSEATHPGSPVFTLRGNKGKKEPCRENNESQREN